MNEWLETLPKKLREPIKSDIIVTGGCIASMLLQEPVNDYDIYLKNIRTAILLAIHYTTEAKQDNFKLRITVKEDFKGLDPFAEGELQYKITEEGSIKRILVDPANEQFLKYIKESVVTFLQRVIYRVEIFIQSDGVYGIDPENNIDDTEEDTTPPIPSEEAQKQKEKYFIQFLSSNAITLTDKIQIVLRFTGNADKIHENYDFAHATNYWTFKDRVVTNKPALEALLSRQLVYLGSKYPLCSIIRTRKFINRDWKIHAGYYVKMALQANELDLTDPDVLEEQLTGVDVAYFYQVIQAVKEKKKAEPDFNFTTSYLCEIIDRMVGH